MDLFDDWMDDSWQLMPAEYSITNQDLDQGSEAGFCDARIAVNLHYPDSDQNYFSIDEKLLMHATPGLATPLDLTETLAINHDSSPSGGNSFDISEHRPGLAVVINQKTFSCSFCDVVVSPSNKEYVHHLKSHGHVCHECGQDYSSHSGLSRHADITGHNAYSCIDCEATFSRFDVLKRHKGQHSAEPLKKYSCAHCKKWKAPNGFVRKDHLTQHLRNYHHIENSTEAGSRFYGWQMTATAPDFYKYCIQEGCSLYRTKEEASRMKYRENLFPTRSAFTKHMREAHDRSTYPCTKPGCKKVGGKGFFRKRDLMKHMKREHDIDLVAEDDVAATTAPEVITNVPEAATSAPEIVSDGTKFFDFQAFLAEEE